MNCKVQFSVPFPNAPTPLPPAFMRGVPRTGRGEQIVEYQQLPQSASLTAPSSKWGPRYSHHS